MAEMSHGYYCWQPLCLAHSYHIPENAYTCQPMINQTGSPSIDLGPRIVNYGVHEASFLLVQGVVDSPGACTQLVNDP